MIVLVDSDILIEVSRGRNEKVLSLWLQLSEARNRVLYSPVSVAELWAGAGPDEHALIDQLFLSLACVPIDESVGKEAGKLLRQFHKSHGLEIADAMIAASAVVSGAVLWTQDRKHYPMKGVKFFG